MDKEEGKGWDFEYAKKVSTEYRKFLVLSLINPNKTIVPSTIIDDFWHLHILDTRKYQKDCEDSFGKFLHHFPYFGMRGDNDEKNLINSWNETLNLYEKEFSNKADSFWIQSRRCPSCGRRVVENNTYSEERPSFKSHNLSAL